MLGNCKWFNYFKGYGFIRAKDKCDIFVHFSDIVTEGYQFLIPGEPVEFRRIVAEKGVQAVDVVRLRPIILNRQMLFERYLGISMSKYKGVQKHLVK